MKRLIAIIAIALSVSVSSKAQECYIPDNFVAVSVYGQPGGIGMELGLWPVDFPIGGFLGGTFVNNSVPYNKVLDTYQVEQAIDIYLKPTFRVNRYLYATTTVGVLSMDSWYISGGARAVLPVSDGSRFAFMVEPQYGTRGFNIQGGAVIALH